MIEFKQLTWQNFLSTGDKPTTIQLNRHSSTLVVGGNGAGKSTMLDALSFALFGKPHRNINKPQLVNSINDKDCLVTVDFSVGPIDYKIVRGIKPNIFEVYRNGKLLNQESHSRDYQKIIEQNILKLNHKSFHQVVVLGSSNFVPFMQLPSHSRRSVIEELLDIGIFTKMNIVLKERSGLLKNKFIETDNQLNILQETIKLQVKHLAELEKIDSSQDKRRNEELADSKEEVEGLLQSNKKLQSEYDQSFDKVSQSLKSAQELKNNSKIEKSSLKLQMDGVVEQAQFYEKHDACPTCAQGLSADLKKEKNSECKNHAKGLNTSYGSVKNTIDEVDKKISTLQKSFTHLNEVNTSIRSNDARIVLINSRIKNLDKKIGVKQDTGKAKAKLLSDQEKRNKLLDEKSQQNQLSPYYDAIGELLRDTGIKTKVIRQYLPVMNKLINQYLQVLDFFVLFNLDESFNETIRSRHRDDFSYASFSEGEKQRIDLSLLFAWRQIAKMKNSANTNLLILDETFDSSMDADGVDNLLKILYTLKDDTRVFVISHKQAELEGKFPAKITFEKNGNFSRIKS